MRSTLSPKGRGKKIRVPHPLSIHPCRRTNVETPGSCKQACGKELPQATLRGRESGSELHALQSFAPRGMMGPRRGAGPKDPGRWSGLDQVAPRGLKSVARTGSVGPRLFVGNRGRTADLQNSFWLCMGDDRKPSEQVCASPRFAVGYPPTSSNLTERVSCSFPVGTVKGL